MKSNKVLKTAITPTRSENYPEWYQQIVKQADLAEISPVRGCMTIKPWGFAIWENMQRVLDEAFKATGHKNLYFPLMIPLNFMQKEADHIKGFAKECAVVTHHKLATNEEGKLIPASPLEEPYIIRPTSEAIIGEAFSRWIQSYRDLPMLVNQWANVVRWELRTRLFLRTTEFLWQEGHTAHATREEAIEEALRMLDVYANFAEEYMAMPVLKGEKSASERFPGAENTYCIEAIMQDKKALQAGTSHFLGQHFARGFNIRYLSAKGKEEYVWTTSWGASTRLIGGLIMTHSDDNGLILPPKLAPAHIVILPIIHQEKDKNTILTYCETLAHELKMIPYHGRNLAVEIDTRELPGGEKAWSWVKKGVPIRIEIGAKECAAHTVFYGRRDKDYKDRKSLSRSEFLALIKAELDDIQTHLFLRAQTFREESTATIQKKEDFYQFFAGEKSGFARVYFAENSELEAKIKAELGVTIRLIPFDAAKEKRGTCIFSGKSDCPEVIFAKAY